MMMMMTLKNVMLCTLTLCYQGRIFMKNDQGVLDVFELSSPAMVFFSGKSL